MFKQVATIVAAAVFVNAEVDPEAVGVKTYTSENCAGETLFSETLFTGDCVQTKKSVEVKELNNAFFNIIKKSGDDDNEFYMFPNKESCKQYGNKFNPEIEVAFIRAPGRNNCYECKQCGSVKSLMFSDVEMSEGSDKTKNKEDSAASATVVSASALIISAAVGLLF